MRELKFKAVRLQGEKDAVAEPFSLYEYVLGSKSEVEEGSVLFPAGTLFVQFTGLKDKNGKEIYEGDIVELHNWEIKDKSIIGKAQVVWDKYYCKFDFLMIDGFSVEDEYDKFRTTPLVIGNIYENPELLEEKE